MTRTQEQSAKAVQEMKTGDVMLTSIRKISGDKFHLEIAEKINTSASKSINVLSILNASDERFQRGGARRAWAPAEMATIVEYFGVDEQALEDLEMHNHLYVDIPSPKLGDINLRVRIIETVEGDDYDNENEETVGKRAGKDGELLTFEGLTIFSKTFVVGCEDGVNPEHILLESDQQKERNTLTATEKKVTKEITLS